MEIKKLLMENGKVVALKIEDGDATYPIRVESLHHPDILDPLLESGWELIKLPYGLRKGNIKLEDLPKGEYSEEGISSDEEVEMAYMTSNLYETTDLKAKMSETNVEYIEFTPSLELIKTREELLGYLDRLNVKNLDSIDPQIILPINAIAKQSALFTVEEYFAPENMRYKDKIESLRKLSIKQFVALVDKFKELGMHGDFKLDNFIDFYFSYGIPGINIPILSKEVGTETIRIDATKAILDEKYVPYYKRRMLTYVDATANVYKDPRFGNSGWQPCDTEEELSKKATMLRSQGFNYIAPIKIEAKVTEPVTYFTSENYEIIYDTDVCVIKSRSGRIFEIPTVSVQDHKFKTIRSDLYDKIVSGSKEFYEELYLDAIATGLLEKTKVNITTSSYDALKTTGASDKSISRYIFKNEDIIQNFYATLREEQANGVGDLSSEGEEGSGLSDATLKGLQQCTFSGVYVDKAKALLQGTLHEDDPDYELISRVWDAFVDGELLVDNLQQGKLADAASNNKDNYLECFKIAHRFLGISIDEICKKVSAIDLISLDSDSNETTIEFEGNGLAIQIPVKLINNTELAYQQDINDYKNAQSLKAQYVYYVEGAVEELGGVHSEKRHVALFGKCLKLYDSNVMRTLRPVISQLTLKFYDLVEEAGYIGDDKALFANSKNAVVYSWIFQIGYQGKFKIPPVLLPDGMDELQQADPSLRTAIKNSWRNFCDSTVKMMDLTLDERGEFYSYCTNAMVTPYYVLPRKGFSEIKVYPFVPTFVNTLGPSFDEKVSAWIKERKMPLVYESDGTIQRGFASDYVNCCAPAEDLSRLNTDVEGLPRYWTDAVKYLQEMGTDYNLGNPPHPYEKSRAGYIWDPVEEPRINGETGPQMWRVDACYQTDREAFVARNIEFSKLYNPERRVALREVGFFRFKGYEAEDFLAMSDLDDLGFLAPLEGKQAITMVVDNLTVKFGDKVARYTDIEDLYETGEYKIKRITGRKFICEDVRGLLIGVVV